jgi:hypothetical protein
MACAVENVWMKVWRELMPRICALRRQSYSGRPAQLRTRLVNPPQIDDEVAFDPNVEGNDRHGMMESEASVSASAARTTSAEGRVNRSRRYRTRDRRSRRSDRIPAGYRPTRIDPHQLVSTTSDGGAFKKLSRGALRIAGSGAVPPGKVGRLPDLSGAHCAKARMACREITDGAGKDVVSAPCFGVVEDQRTGNAARLKPEPGECGAAYVEIAGNLRSDILSI